MSVGNLKTYGNKGNNFPFQLKTLKGLGMGQLRNLTEVALAAASADLLEVAINAYFNANPDSYLVSKTVIYDSATPEFVTFLSIAEL